MSSAAVLARTVLLSLTDESSRRKIGWVLAAIFSPVILIVALLCCLLGGTSEHNTSMVELCFHGGALPENVPAEYRIYMEDMQSSFSKLDELIEEINCMTEGDERLDDTRVKAIFYALYFGADDPQSAADPDFVDCFVTYAEPTRTVTVIDENGNEVEQEETYTVAVPITDLETIWSKVSAVTGLTISAEQKRNADSIYNLVRYGSSAGTEGWIPGTETPYIGADGFCSPIGSGWQSRVTSEFGYRKDPFTGETRGHTGMDLSVPTGTPIRAALSGTVTVSQYNSSYGYYVVVDHGSGLSTLYAHNSKLLVRVGQTVEAGDIVSLSGSTGRSTGPHLHFEVRVNGERTNPRYYLPT